MGQDKKQNITYTLLKILIFFTIFISTQVSALTISGTCKQADKVTDCTDTGTIRVAHHGSGGTLLPQTQSIVAGTWSITGLPALATGLIITVFIEGASDHQEAVAVFNYGSTVGDVTGVELIETHLSIGADTTWGISNNDLSTYDNSKSGSEDIFHDVDAARTLTVDSTGAVPNETLYIKNGYNYAPGGDINTHHVDTNGTFGMGNNTINVSGDWNFTNGTFNRDTSTVNFTGSGSIRNDTSPWWGKSFYNVNAAAAGQTTTIVLGQGIVVKNLLTLGTGTIVGGVVVLNKTGTALVTAGATLANSQFKYSPPAGGQVDITVADYPELWLAENSPTSNSTISLIGDITCKTLKLNGNGSDKITTLNTAGHNITCNNLTVGSTNNRKGRLILNNSILTINNDVNIVAPDTGTNELDAGNSILNIGGDWINSSVFTAGTSNVFFNGASNQFITSGGDPFYNLTLNNTGSPTQNIVTLQDPLVINNDLTVTTGKLNTSSINNQPITVLRDFNQNSTTGEVEANASAITVSGDFNADGTLDSTNYNNASVTLNGAGSLLYANIFQRWRNGFNNLTVGQAGQTTLTSMTFTVLNELSVGSGALAGSAYIYLGNYQSSGSPLSLDPAAVISIDELRFFGGNQTIPPLANGYDCNIKISRSNLTLTQTGNITLNTGNHLFINGDDFVDRSLTYNTNGFDLNIGGNLILGAGSDTALKTLNISNSNVTISGDLNIKTGTNALTSTNSNIILNGTGVQNITTNGKAFDTLTQTNASAAGVIFNDGFTVNQLTNTTPNSKMTFTSGETYTINNGVTLQGASGQLITLAPSIAGSHWNFNLNSGATKAIDYVSVSWSDASGSHSTQKRIDPNNSLDDGNTIDWFYKTIITVNKEATLISDPINGSGTNKNHIPGAIVKYNITTSNTGTASPDANTVTIVDHLDTNVEYDVTTGIMFTDGTTPSDLSLGTVSYSHRSTPSDYTYTPTGAFDPNVASLKIETSGVFAFGGLPAPEFSVQFQVRIK